MVNEENIFCTFAKKKRFKVAADFDFVAFIIKLYNNFFWKVGLHFL